MFRYFTRAEFACKHCGANLMSLDFISRLDDLRHACGFPLKVTSGYRCPVHNAAVSSTGANGPHTSGKAVDFGVERDKAHRLLAEAMKMGFRGIGVQQKGGGRFIHLDDARETPTVWSY